MEYALNEIFPLENHEDYYCKIYRYKLSHSLLYVQVKNPKLDRLFYVGFHDVYYFSGKTLWQGADFRISSAPESAAFMRDLEPKEDIDDLILGLYRIYTFKGFDTDTQILAQIAYVVDEVKTYGEG